MWNPFRKASAPRTAAIAPVQEVRFGLNSYGARALQQASRFGALNHADVVNRALLMYAALQRMTVPGDASLKVVRGDDELWINFI
ncbi:hypothetical protein [Dactylosporangium sp. CA-139066]|uniref:hypothetical protein n=1 Tax=Dactylosporangium sp. CA-139066 TaxID=3239930 RepID=UPI003D8DA60C